MLIYRTKLICSAIIMGFALSGCGDDQYAIERRFYWAQKQAEKIFNNPKSSPPNELARVVETWQKFISRHPDHSLSVEAGFNIARLFLVKEQYDQARQQLKNIIIKYAQPGAKNEGIRSEALFLIGNSYQAQDNWNAALAEYQKIMRDYPATVRGMEIPVYIARYYKVKQYPDKTREAYAAAISHYKGLAGKHPATPLAFTADKLITRCYIALEDWPRTIEGFNHILEQYKGKVMLDSVLMEMALFYQRNVKDKAKSKEVLERLRREYPQSRLTKKAELLLKENDKK